jgi:hypothetical protein
MSQRRSLITVCLVLVALATVLGHVCVLPGHSHAASGGQHDHEPPAHGHPDVPDGVHVASCEALRSASAPHASPLQVAAVVPVTRLVEVVSSVGPARWEVPAPMSPPPLYLAHRTLLI